MFIWKLFNIFQNTQLYTFQAKSLIEYISILDLNIFSLKIKSILIFYHAYTLSESKALARENIILRDSAVPCVLNCVREIGGADL